jgi:hypothetical protein
MLDETTKNTGLRNDNKTGCLWPSEILVATIYIK